MYQINIVMATVSWVVTGITVTKGLISYTVLAARQDWFIATSLFRSQLTLPLSTYMA